MRLFKRLTLLIGLVYLVPSLAAAAYWASQTHPANWRAADWSSARLLPDPAKDKRARISILAARTGGFKGAFAVHSWIVIKDAGASNYDRFDVVGWGKPVRQNGYEPDGRWYSNRPEIIWQAEGDKAAALIPDIRKAIAEYRYNQKGSYTLWPGPNSNTFVATIMRAVPEIDAVLPPNAVGRDFLGPSDFAFYDRSGNLNLTLYGLVGLSAGSKSGFEVHLLGLVAGFDISRPALKIPAVGRLALM
ncbi:DUF3750 domain-containing protein [Rhizobium alvei]|uniref:DUF3750 domain-containing protein n=1 Tax=Rhizobium alvei TaxID=1132659 RepID=A0ABT8YI54_9HYPH|nr:DUF3750 domain-containing protein [Rhizobium alvei]MDO6962950.1 DUF3750 domain-containing protein [Rhizobium alvei]